MGDHTVALLAAVAKKIGNQPYHQPGVDITTRWGLPEANYYHYIKKCSSLPLCYEHQKGPQNK
jgi:hypothetical protein